MDVEVLLTEARERLAKVESVVATTRADLAGAKAGGLRTVATMLGAKLERHEKSLEAARKIVEELEGAVKQKDLVVESKKR